MNKKDPDDVSNKIFVMRMRGWDMERLELLARREERSKANYICWLIGKEFSDALEKDKNFQAEFREILKNDPKNIKAGKELDKNQAKIRQLQNRPRE